VVQSFSEYGMLSWNAWVAWIAILIDYLEVPVIVEMLKQIYVERAEIAHRLRLRFSGGTSAHAAGNVSGVRTNETIPAR
jgi:hypothetical protein